MDGWIVLLWIFSPIVLAVASVAAAVALDAGSRIRAERTPFARLTCRLRGATGADRADPAPQCLATLAATELVHNPVTKVSYCERSRIGCPLPVLRDSFVCRVEAPRKRRGGRRVALIGAGGRERIVRQLCLTMNPITNIAAGILIANNRYAELPLPLLASVALAFLIATLESRDDGGEPPMTDNRDAETPHPLFGRKTC